MQMYKNLPDNIFDSDYLKIFNSFVSLTIGKKKSFFTICLFLKNQYFISFGMKSDFIGTIDHNFLPNYSTSRPAFSKPRSSPPQPANNETTFTLFPPTINRHYRCWHSNYLNVKFKAGFNHRRCIMYPKTELPASIHI